MARNNVMRLVGAGLALALGLALAPVACTGDYWPDATATPGVDDTAAGAFDHLTDEPGVTTTTQTATSTVDHAGDDDGSDPARTADGAVEHLTGDGF